MDVHVLCGFLGSGKTTLARRILGEKKESERLAVIVNEFGQVGIDGQILQGGNIDLIEVSAGCFCCTLKGSLVNAIEELRDRTKADRVVIEASGLSQPAELVEVLRDPAIADAVTLGPVVTVVDAGKFHGYRKVLGPFYLDQVRRADVLLLNKTDLAGADDLERIREDLADLNPRALIVATQRCNVELKEIMETSERKSVEPSALEQGLASPAPAASFVSFVVPAPFNARRGKVEAFFVALPETVMRAKGFMTIDGQTCLVQFAGGRLEVEVAEKARSLSMVFISSVEPDRAGIEAALKRTAGS
jgi:G3E family GTPase